MGRLVRLLEALQRELRKACLEAGVSPTQGRVLLCLSREEPTTSSRISLRTGLSPSAMTSVVDSLERRGLARRSEDPDDRRSRPLFLTEAGEDVRRKISGAISAAAPGRLKTQNPSA